MDPLKKDRRNFKRLVRDLFNENKSKQCNFDMFSKLYDQVVKLKKSSTMSVLPPRVLFAACKILAYYILNIDAASTNSQVYSRKEVLDSNMASLTILQILTSSALDKCVYSEDVIDKITTFILKQTFDNCEGGSKITGIEEIKEVQFLKLAVNLLTDLIITHSLIDIQIQKIISIGHHTVRNCCNSLKINGIWLLSVVFTNYENKQLFILNEIQDLMVNCSLHEESTLFPIRMSSKSISIYCALVMTLLQSAAILPGAKLVNSSLSDLRISEKVEPLNPECMESIVCKRYKNVLLYSQYMMYEFLRNCINQNGSHIIHYQTALNSFIRDLLNVLMEPEWPASHILLFDLAKNLVNVLHNSNINTKIKLMCMNWLSEIMVKVMECAQLSKNNDEKLNNIILKAHHSGIKCDNDGDSTSTLNEDTKFQDLQSIFLMCVIGKIQAKQPGVSIENFYITMWYSDLIEQEKLLTSKSLNNQAKCSIDDNKENVPPSNIKIKPKKSSKKIKNVHQKKIQKKKEYLIQLSKTTTSVVNSLHHFDNDSLFLNHSDIKLITSFFIRNGNFLNNFDLFLNHIINMLNSEQPCVRAKAMQCLKLFMDADIAFAKNPLIQFIMQNFLKDTCISVREISVDFIGKSISHMPDKCELYYPLILPHLWDKSVSVRKHVLKVLKDITTHCPNFPKLFEVHMKILERIEDPAMKSMVTEIFKNKWFTPSNSADKMIDPIKDLTKVIKSSGENGFQHLKVLVEELFDSKETAKNCKQFVKCLVHYVLENEVNNSINDLCDCLKMLNIIAEVKPKIIVPYVSALQPYLYLCHQESENIILSVTGILKCTIPFLENPPETFIVKLEEDLLKLLILHKHSVVESVVPCLIVIVQQITHNDKVIYDSYNMFFGAIEKFSKNELIFLNKELSVESYIKRCLLIVGLFLKYYDFSNHHAQEYFEKETIDNTFNTFMLLLKNHNSGILWYTLKAIGEICCQHSHYLLNDDLKVFYCDILSSQNGIKEMKHQVLSNIRHFLEENPLQMIKQEKLKGRQKEATFDDQISLQEDENSTIILVIQQYLNEIMNCCIIQDQKVRWAAATILNIIIQCGFIPPQKITSHIIALTTDCDILLSQKAHNVLKQIDEIHPGNFDFCIKVGINLSYELQTHICKTELIRGYNDEETPSHALLTSLYQIVQRKKLRRRNFLSSILKQYEEMDVDVNKMLYLSENLAYLPYELEDEVLFITQFIAMIAATKGYDHVKKFQQQLLLDESTNKVCLENDNECSESEDNENLQNIMKQLPSDISTIQECVFSFQSCLLLLKVGQYLKQTYGITDEMVILYSEERAKIPVKLSIDSYCKLVSQSHLQVLLGMKTKKNLNKEQLINQYLELKNLVLSGDVCYPKKRQRNDRDVSTPRKKKKMRPRK